MTGARRPSEDEVLAGVELPRVFCAGTQVLASAALVVAVVGSLRLDGGDARASLLAVGATYLPWLLSWLGVRFSHLGFAVAVLAPITAATILELAGWDDPLGEAALPNSLLIMMMLALTALAPRRQLLAVAGASYAVVLARGLADGSPMTVLAWQLVFVFTVGGIAGVRAGVLALAAAEETAAADDVLAERRAIAREVRAVVARALTVTVGHITAARRAVQQADEAEAEAVLEGAELRGRAGLADIRRIVRLLRADDESALDPVPSDVTGVHRLAGAADAAVEGRLADLDIPMVRNGASLLAIAIAVAGVGSALALDDDAAFTAAVMAVALVPWVVELGQQRMMKPLTFAGLVLLAPVLCIGREWLDDGPGLWEDHHPATSGAQFSLLLVSLMVVATVLASRRDTVLALGASWIVVLVWALVCADPDFAVDWVPTIALSSLAAVAIRAGALSIARAERALAAHTAAEDRRRIARDVHDVTAHTLAVTMLHVTAARMAVTRHALDDADEALEEAERHGRACLADIQGIVGLLEGDGDPVAPHVSDVAELVEGFRSAGLQVDLRMQGTTAGTVTPATGLIVYRVIQEALANAVRHGSGTVSVTVEVLDDEVALDVTNPTSAETRTAPARGSGLVGMRERVRSVGGRIDVGIRDRRWQVRARLPLRPLQPLQEVTG